MAQQPTPVIVLLTNQITAAKTIKTFLILPLAMILGLLYFFRFFMNPEWTSLIHTCRGTLHGDIISWGGGGGFVDAWQPSVVEHVQKAIGYCAFEGESLQHCLSSKSLLSLCKWVQKYQI